MTSAPTKSAPEPGAVARWEWRGLLRRPPRLVFHGVLVVTGLIVLWAFSFPGVHFLAVFPCIGIVGVAAITWVARAITYLVARHRGTCRGRAAWFAVAPLGAVALGALLATHVPLRLRWEFSKPSFDDALEDVRSDPNGLTEWNPRRIGTYKINIVRVVQQGIVFYDDVGALFDDAGFAYLPEGPSDDMANGNFENPQWFALGDHWYAWTASW